MAQVSELLLASPAEGVEIDIIYNDANNQASSLHIGAPTGAKTLTFWYQLVGDTGPTTEVLTPNSQGKSHAFSPPLQGTPTLITEHGVSFTVIAWPFVDYGFSFSFA